MHEETKRMAIIIALWVIGGLIVIGIAIGAAVTFSNIEYVDPAIGECEETCEALGYEYHYCKPGETHSYGNEDEDHCWCETPDGEVKRIY